MEKFNQYLSHLDEWWRNERQYEHLKMFLPDETIVKLKTFAQALEETYPDLYELRMRYIEVDELYITCIIKFPEVTIKNSDNITHKIYDLFVQFEVIGGDLYEDEPSEPDEEDYRFRFSGLRGFRQTMTYSEMVSGYRHSHLESGAIGSKIPATRFCMGEGEIVQLMMKLNEQGFISLNEFKYFLFSIQAFVEWESLEGVPHIKMRSIVTGNPLRDEISNTYIDTLDAKYKNSYFSSRINIQLDMNGKLTVVEDDAYEDACATFIRYAFSTTTGLFVYMDDAGRYYNGTRNDTIVNRVRDKILFRGQEYDFTIIDVPNDNLTLFVHPQIKRHLKNKIEYELKKIQLIATIG